MMKTIKPLVLIVLDGFGYRETKQYNAIANANTPNWNKLWQTCPHALIEGSGHGVGLPPGQMGNSEVGHLTIGAGRIVYQEYTRIDHAIENQLFETNQVFLDAFEKANSKNAAVHVMGLLSPGGVHSHEDQIIFLLKLAVKHNVSNLYFHAFLDGRDTPPQSAEESLKKINNIPGVKIASIIGRYYAMDRDKRWERIEKAYDLLTQAKADYSADDAITGLKQAYLRGETDEFVKPTSIHEKNTPAVKINNNDSIIFMNFRADRARQLTRAFTEENFDGFHRNFIPKLAEFVTLTQYAADIKANVAFPPQSLDNVLGEYIAKLGLKQFRIAETEKYAHVTFFFNGGREKPFDGEERLLIPSPKVATYDLKPEMSAIELTQALNKAILSKKYSLIVCNFANPDMVGHTGNYDAAVKAIETIDGCIGEIVEAIKKADGEMIITADHGNAECMYDDVTKQPHTAHTSDPVPFVYIGQSAKITENNGCLADVAPTILYLMDLPKPDEMTGKSLLKLI